MRRTGHAFILVTVAIAAISPAAAASGHPARTMARAVTAHIRVKAAIPVGRKPFGVAADPRTKSTWPTSAAARCR
jgi:DNA-binding beta-propeller fold protein YncE